MDRRLGTAILVMIVGVIIVAALVPLLPIRGVKSSELGVLGPNATTQGFPTSVAVNQSFLLYGFVGDHEGSVENYQVIVKVGNQSTTVSDATFAVAPTIQTYWRILNDNQTWLFPMNLSLSHVGNETRLIFELWTYNIPSSNYEYTGLWDQIWLNVTA